jgi:hypothetical protein
MAAVCSKDDAMRPGLRELQEEVQQLVAKIQQLEKRMVEAEEKVSRLMAPRKKVPAKIMSPEEKEDIRNRVRRKTYQDNKSLLMLFIFKLAMAVNPVSAQSRGEPAR